MIKKILLAIFLILFMLEAFARVVLPPNTYNQIFQISDNPKILYELKPDSKVIFRGIYTKIPAANINISKSGLRDRYYPFFKGEDVFRIAVVGDSIAFGWGVEVEASFPKELERMLNRKGKKRFEVMNFGVPGYNIIQETAVLKEKVSKYNIDVLIINHNPSDFFKTFNYFRPPFVNPYFSKFSYFYRYVVQLCFSYRENKQSRKHPPPDSEMDEMLRSIDEIVEISKRQNFKIMMACEIIHPWMDYFVKECKKNDIIIMEYYSDVYLEGLKDKTTISKKDRHPNDLGHKIIAQKILKELVRNGLLLAN